MVAKTEHMIRLVERMSEEKNVNSIIRAVNVLRVISEGTNKLSSISKKLQLAKGTIHRILKTLEGTGMIKQDSINHQYFLGPLAIRLSSSFSITHDFLLYCSRQELIRLRDFSRETVNIQIRMGLQRICIEEFVSPEEIKYISGMGSIYPIYLGSAGKMLLAEMSDEDLMVLLEHISFDPVCINTITKKSDMLKEIREIRKKGYAVSFSERLRGSASISVPIRNYPFPIVLSILGLENRCDEATMKKNLEEMLESATRISLLLNVK
jgi:DNA-binding IclR family transcriptional regulator